MPSFRNWWERSYSAKRERILLHILFWIAYLCFLSFTAFEHLRTNRGSSIPVSLLIWLSPVYLVWVYYFFIRTTYAFLQLPAASIR